MTISLSFTRVRTETLANVRGLRLILVSMNSWLRNELEMAVNKNRLYIDMHHDSPRRMEIKEYISDAQVGVQR